MKALEVVQLPPVMALTAGKPEITVGLLDGPVARSLPHLASQHIRALPDVLYGECTRPDSVACMHGTVVASILCAKRGSAAPAICPGCTLLVYPIFVETPPAGNQRLGATPEELAAGLMMCIDAGARILNLSPLTEFSGRGERALVEALDYAARREVIVVAAAGNQATLRASAITHHPWVIPVVAYDLRGRLTPSSTLGSSIGRNGLGAPGEDVPSLGADGHPLTSGGTSVAAAFVTGTVALLWSEFPAASAAQIKRAVTQATTTRRKTVVPPLLNAWAAYQALMTTHIERGIL